MEIKSPVKSSKKLLLHEIYTNKFYKCFSKAVAVFGIIFFRRKEHTIRNISSHSEIGSYANELRPRKTKV